METMCVIEKQSRRDEKHIRCLVKKMKKREILNSQDYERQFNETTNMQMVCCCCIV